MRSLFPLLILVAACLAGGECGLPVFQKNAFKEHPCDSEENRSNYFGIGSDKRQGNCLVSSECGQQGGLQSGSCAAGFGVCCLFKINTEDDNGLIRVTRNNTYVQNPNFPVQFEQAESFKSFNFLLEKQNKGICAFRLQFDALDLNPPVSEDTSCMDKLAITVSNGQNIPEICGWNTGQHIYIDVSTELGSLSEIATLHISTEGTHKLRHWDIQVQQIECSNLMMPPQGCLQYHTESSGTIKTFNFDGSESGPHLPNQDYKVCIRRDFGFCCLEYQERPSYHCITLPKVWTHEAAESGIAPAGEPRNLYKSLEKTELGHEAVLFITFENYYYRFCGAILNTVDDAVGAIPIITCTSNEVTIITDDGTDSNGDLLRGACLRYRQIPC